MKAYWEGEYVVWLDDSEAPHEYMREITSTELDAERCRHENGWYVTVKFWVFAKRTS